MDEGECKKILTFRTSLLSVCLLSVCLSVVCLQLGTKELDEEEKKKRKLQAALPQVGLAQDERFPPSSPLLSETEGDSQV